MRSFGEAHYAIQREPASLSLQVRQMDCRLAVLGHKRFTFQQFKRVDLLQTLQRGGSLL